MIFPEELQERIFATLAEHPDKPLVMPDHAYTAKGDCRVWADGLSISLHRWLYEQLIGPLGFYDTLHDLSGVKGNVNPHLFLMVPHQAKNPLRTHCAKGHPYEGNEAPPNSYGYRCRRCMRAMCARQSKSGGMVLPNSEKTHCPHGHEYTKKNTVRGKDGKRRCRTCISIRSRARYAQKKAQKEKS